MAAGTDPNSRTSFTRPQVSVTTGRGGGEKLAITFRVARGPLDGSENMQSSTDLHLWGTPAIQLIPTGQQDANGIEVRAEVPVDAASMFLRVKVGHP